MYAPNNDSDNCSKWSCLAMNAGKNVYDITNHTTLSSYSDSAGYATYANWGGKKNSSYTRKIIEDASISISGTTTSESQNHTHSVTASGTISGDSETRPVNYTMKIWKRIA